MKKIMKKIMTLIVLIGISTGIQAEEKGWWDSFLSMVGLGEETEQVAEGPSANGLMDSLMANLGVSETQAQGGLAALFNYAKQNISAEQFEQLSQYIPGAESVMQYLPAVDSMKQEGLGGLIDKAAGTNESLGQLNNLRKQFDALGLDTEMIQKYVQQAKSYLDTPEGQQAKNLLMESLPKLTG